MYIVLWAALPDPRHSAEAVPSYDIDDIPTHLASTPLTLVLVQLRFLLAIPPSQPVLFERFSDSAGAYTILDSNNPSVYKQLYRAAKAKLKLRLKATLINDLATASPITTEVSPDDCLNSQRYDPATNLDQTTTVSKNAECGERTDKEAEKSRIHTCQAMQSLQAQAYDLYMNSVMQSSTIREGLGSQFVTDPRPSIGATVKSEETTSIKKDPVEEAPVPSSFSARESFFAELAGISIPHPTHMRKGEQCLNLHDSYSVFCNECDRAIPGAHYHCSICDDGDFDLCQRCVDSGVLCGGEGHWLIKRIVKNGKVINSTTETIAPKAMKVETEKERPDCFTSEVKKTTTFVILAWST